MVLLNVPADPTISLSVQFAVGSQNDPPGKEGLAFLTGEMLADAATEVRSLDEILAALYPLAASYGMRVDIERTTLAGRVHRDNLAPFLELYTDAFLKPAFDEDDFERVRSDAINAIENTLRYSSDEELGKAALHDLVFSGTPYAHLCEGTVAGLRVDHPRRRARVLSPPLHARERGRRHRWGLRRGGRRTARSGGAATTGRHRGRAAGDRHTIDRRPFRLGSSTSQERMPRSASGFRSTCAAASAISTRYGSRTRGSASTAINRAICST